MGSIASVLRRLSVGMTPRQKVNFYAGSVFGILTPYAIAYGMCHDGSVGAKIAGTLVLGTVGALPGFIVGTGIGYANAQDVPQKETIPGDLENKIEAQ